MHPTKGQFKRIDNDLAAAAPWLVTAELLAGLAAQDPDPTIRQKLVALDKLLSNWPMHFVYVSSESDVLARSIQYRDGNEALREYFGLDGPSLLLIIEKVEEELKNEGSGKHGPAEIESHLATKINWSEGGKSAPKCKTIEQWQGIITRLKACPRAHFIFEVARARFGRDTIFDELSKVHLVTQKNNRPRTFFAQS